MYMNVQNINNKVLVTILKEQNKFQFRFSYSYKNLNLHKHLQYNF